MREIRSSGLEGGVEFNPPSLPLFYSTMTNHVTSFVFQAFGVRRQSGAATALWLVPPGPSDIKAASPSVATALHIFRKRIYWWYWSPTDLEVRALLQTSKSFGMIRPSQNDFCLPTFRTCSRDSFPVFFDRRGT